MKQRQLRLGDILDDYCPRERRVTNHAVVALVGEAVKQTRCTTCDAEHEYKHAKIPRQRRKTETPAVLYAQVLANGPKPSRTTRRFPRFDEIADPAERRRVIIRLHADGWMPQSIAEYLGTSRQTVHTTLRRWAEEQFAGLVLSSLIAFG